MFNVVLRLGSELPLQSTVWVLGVQDGELGIDGPRRSACRDEPEQREETQKIHKLLSITHSVHH